MPHRSGSLRPQRMRSGAGRVDSRLLVRISCFHRWLESGSRNRYDSCISRSVDLRVQRRSRSARVSTPLDGGEAGNAARCPRSVGAKVDFSQGHQLPTLPKSLATFVSNGCGRGQENILWHRRLGWNRRLASGTFPRIEGAGEATVQASVPHPFGAKDASSSLERFTGGGPESAGGPASAEPPALRRLFPELGPRSPQKPATLGALLKSIVPIHQPRRMAPRR